MALEKSRLQQFAQKERGAFEANCAPA